MIDKQQETSFKAMEEQAKRTESRAALFRDLFGTPQGKRVLEELKKLGYRSKTTIEFSVPANDPFKVGFKEGQRVFVENIIQLIESVPGEFLKVLEGIDNGTKPESAKGNISRTYKTS